MCGIAGFNLSQKDKGCTTSRLIARAMLMRIVRRGEDATGMAWAQDDEVFYIKDDVPAYNFIPALDEMPRDASNVILHTRWATKGDPSNNDNNHPIVLPDIVGVHNGHIANDDFLFDLYQFERKAEVDSEVIFHLLAQDEPLADLTFLEGRAAVGWIRVSDPNTLHLARLTGSPLTVAQTQGGSLVFASTEPLLREAATIARLKLTQVWDVPEWTYLRVIDGRIVEMSDILTGADLNAEPISASI